MSNADSDILLHLYKRVWFQSFRCTTPTGEACTGGVSICMGDCHHTQVCQAKAF